MSDWKLLTHRLLVAAALLASIALDKPRTATGSEPDSDPATAAEKQFTKDILPILKQHCYECHSHAAKKIKGGLVLDSRAGWMTGGDSGPAVIPGKPDESPLIGAVRYDDLQMPPSGKLPADVIQLLERWVASGAADPRVQAPSKQSAGIDLEAGRRHWAFQDPIDHPIPDVQLTDWPRNSIDRFILARLERQKLRPIADADRYTWLRRVTFDLTGLPPTVAEIEQFVADRSPTARETVVDRLLTSRAFGERWARHWLDLVGYADQIGTSNNVFAQHAWRYRDFVIDSLVNDKPFDHFIRQQIAGDLLPFDSVEQRADNLVATGFLVLGDIEIVEADKAKLLVDIADQQLAKVGKAFLGLTIDCARCHDHKFDPIPQRDYYALAGIFNATSSVFKTDRGVWSDVNVVDLPETEAQLAERKQREQEHAARLQQSKDERTQLQKRKAELDEQLKATDLSEEQKKTLTTERDQAQRRIGTLNRQITHAEFFVPTVPQAHGVSDRESPDDMQITIRGNPRALGERVPRGFLSVVADTRPTIPADQSGRRELADWIASPDNPLTARVTVNRVWQKLFGRGLVRTVDYFGIPGDSPSHPELLDHLAIRFVDNGWSLRKLIRTLVLSRTYALDSRHDDHAAAVDPENRLLWRMHRFRLDAEALRDAMLMTSGQLQTTGGGPALPLEYPENVANVDPANVNPPSFSLSRWRPQQKFERTIYLPVIRSSAQPGPAELRNVFDFAQPSQFSGQRAITAVPTQALFLMNGPVVKEHAQALAQLLSQQASEETARLELLWLRVLNRPITAEERVEANQFLQSTTDSAWVELCHAILASNEFLMRL